MAKSIGKKVTQLTKVKDSEGSRVFCDFLLGGSCGLENCGYSHVNVDKCDPKSVRKFMSTVKNALDALKDI